MFTPKNVLPRRDPRGTFGAARWATSAERRTMSSGLELGIDRVSGRTVRVSIDGNLLTIAPPRKGKTSGVIIPNLAFPERRAWGGPAVVIDPKGEVYRAVAGRRREMGRTVRCLDPLNLVGGTDCWNPLQGLDPSDVLYLQQTALALLPETSDRNEAAAYFRNRASDLIVGAMIVALRSERRNVVEVLRLLNDDASFTEGLAQFPREPAALSALSILNDDPGSRDHVKSTAAQAFSWLADKRLRKLVAKSTFDLSDLAVGDVDLFVAVPTRDKNALAPFLRWLLDDIFNAIRANRPAERIVIFIDEAAALGRFDAILTASGELPGYGGSLWTIWQDRAQMVTTYGEDGASTLLRTAEIVTLFDVPAIDPDESDRWSRALGDYTAMIDITSGGGQAPEKPSVATSPQVARLMTKEGLTAMASNELIVFPNSRHYARHPLRLRKTYAYADPRFKGLVEDVQPVGRV